MLKHCNSEDFTRNILMFVKIQQNIFNTMESNNNNNNNNYSSPSWKIRLKHISIFYFKCPEKIYV